MRFNTQIYEIQEVIVFIRVVFKWYILKWNVLKLQHMLKLLSGYLDLCFYSLFACVSRGVNP